MHAWCNPQVASWKLVSLWPSTADSGPWSEFHLDASWAPCASIWVPDWHPSLLWAGPAGTLIVMRNWKHPGQDLSRSLITDLFGAPLAPLVRSRQQTSTPHACRTAPTASTTSQHMRSETHKPARRTAQHHPPPPDRRKSAWCAHTHLFFQPAIKTYVFAKSRIQDPILGSADPLRFMQ